MIRLITKKRLELLEKCEAIVAERDAADIPVYHCGAKSCQYAAACPAELAMHRQMEHKG